MCDAHIFTLGFLLVILLAHIIMCAHIIMTTIIIVTVLVAVALEIISTKMAKL
jgi:hypothetical protein